MNAKRTICAACGLPGHRFGRNEGMERYDPMACINLLSSKLDRWRDIAIVLLTNSHRCDADTFLTDEQRTFIESDATGSSETTP